MKYHDHHFHPFGYAALIHGLELFDASNFGEVLRRLVAHGERVEGPVVAERLNEENLAELRLPTAADLDQAFWDRPVLVYRYCGHVAIANTATLKIAAVDASTPDPEGGSFDRHPDGTPNGVLRETAADLVTSALSAHIPPLTDGEVIGALATLRDLGIGSVTSIVSAGEPIWAAVEDEIDALVRIAPELPVEMDVLVITRDPGALAEAKRRLDHANGPVRFHGWKDFSDGSFGGHTAAMYEAYADRPDTTGTVRLDHNKAVEMGLASYRMGGVVAIHAIGDLANDLVLDVMEELSTHGVDPGSLRIEHASIMTDAAIERMGRLGVTASVQPTFMTSEETWLVKRLGPERFERAYPFKSLLEAGVPLIGGSDSPVELPDPRTGIDAAVNRPGFNPAERLSPEEAEAMFHPPVR
jgi:predicted amidohydrolase YtcJ